ncbi:hypothetical protein U1872_14495 [Sphingomonas sp. RB3P16]|uniref:hypothetical protein n=1 Tax=Parasphingomonas frigoris TaxID=3096163 RepID=UPI002FC9D5F2
MAGSVQAGGHYEATLDRAGLALGAGGAVGGLFAMLLVGIGSEPDPSALLVGFCVGALITAMAAVAIGGPVWLLCHVLGRRGPRSAITIGALAGFALFLGAQSYGFGLVETPPGDAPTLLYRAISAVATSLVLAAVAALIGWTMWRTAYRRVR